MAEYITTDAELTSIADAIRTKGGTTESLTFPTGFVSAINAISGGGLTVTDLYKDSTTINPPQNFSDLLINISAIGLNIAICVLESSSEEIAYLYQPLDDIALASQEQIDFVGFTPYGRALAVSFFQEGNEYILESVTDVVESEDVTEDWGTMLSCRIYHIID